MLDRGMTVLHHYYCYCYYHQQRSLFGPNFLYGHQKATARGMKPLLKKKMMKKWEPVLYQKLPPLHRPSRSLLRLSWEAQKRYLILEEEGVIKVDRWAHFQKGDLPSIVLERDLEYLRRLGGEQYNLVVYLRKVKL